MSISKLILGFFKNYILQYLSFKLKSEDKLIEIKNFSTSKLCVPFLINKIVFLVELCKSENKGKEFL